MADFHSLPTEALVQMRVADHLSAWERAQEIEILPPWWQGWNPFRICVGGRIRKQDVLEAARADDSQSRRINWPRVAGLMKFGGIRIEDNLAITATGCENLTRDAFRAAVGVA